MAARAARTPAMRMVASTVGGDTCFSSPVPFYGIGILCRALAGQVGRFSRLGLMPRCRRLWTPLPPWRHLFAPLLLLVFAGENL